MGQEIPFFTVGEIKDTSGDAGGGAFKPYPDGDYTLRNAEVKLESSKKGELKLQVTASIIDGPNGSTDYRTKKTVFSVSLTQKAKWVLREFMVACGIQKGPEERLNTDDFEGKVYRAVIKTDTYTDPTTGEVKPTNQVRKFRPNKA